MIYYNLQLYIYKFGEDIMKEVGTIITIIIDHIFIYRIKGALT